jgi:dTDP-4-dehydrorhamnose reductase
VPLIHFSTDYVFDGMAIDRGVRMMRPVYGASNLAGETVILSATGRISSRESHRFLTIRGTNFLQTIARFARHRRELRIVTDQIGAPTSPGAIARAGHNDPRRECFGAARGVCPIGSCLVLSRIRSHHTISLKMSKLCLTAGRH